MAAHDRVHRGALTRLRLILAIDQGTTGSTCLVVDEGLQVLGRGYRELPQHFPRPGWVEHDPEEIWQSVLGAAAEALDAAGARAADLSTVLRSRTSARRRCSGIERPVSPLRRRSCGRTVRTAERCRELDPDLIRERTGLVRDPYFSATKLEWLLREHRRDGLVFGTVDTWLVWKLTRGAVHVTDTTNASRTMLVALSTLDWDDELLAVFDIERDVLPRIVRSTDPSARGRCSARR